MINILLMKRSKELEELSKNLGFSENWFLDTHFVLLEGRNKKALLQQAQQAKAKKLYVVYKASEEEVLRFVLEKVPVDVVFGIETIHAKDSVHFVRGGLDQILCSIIQNESKTIGFSFSALLNSTERSKLLGRMMFNMKLCQKYNVKTLLSTFANSPWEIRSRKDLEAMGRIL